VGVGQRAGLRRTDLDDLRQAVELDAHVRKGEQGSPVVYANSITRTETDADSGVDVARDIHFLKGYTVFNVEQIDGLPAQYTAPASRASTCPPASPARNAFSARPMPRSPTAATVPFIGPRQTASCYRPSRPSAIRELLRTLAHEMTHWAAHESRLARDFGTQRFRVRRLRDRRTRGRTQRRVPLVPIWI